jgi:predicted dehydrogenase
LEFESGPLAYVGSNFATPRLFYLNVYGTEANAFAEAEGSKLSLQKKGGEDREPVEMGEPVDIILEEMAEFGRCVREGSRPEVSGAEGVRAIAAVEAIVRSAETGKTINLKELIGSN